MPRTATRPQPHASPSDHARDPSGPGEGATQQVMAGFAEAYRAWLEAMSAKPETMLDLQGRYMQEQMGLWVKALQPEDKEAHQRHLGDKRFSAPEWDELPVFRYFRDSYLLTSKMMMEAVEEANLDAPTKQSMRFFMRQYLDAGRPDLMTHSERPSREGGSRCRRA